MAAVVVLLLAVVEAVGVAVVADAEILAALGRVTVLLQSGIFLAAPASN